MGSDGRSTVAMAEVLRFMAPMQKSRSKLTGTAILVAGVAVMSVPALTEQLSYYSASKIALLGLVFAVVGVALLLKGR